MLVTKIQESSVASEYTCEEIKKSIIENLIKVFGSYDDPHGIIPLLEENDLFGNDCMFYIAEYELSHILNQRIFDSYINQKWNGRFDAESSIFDHSMQMQIYKTDTG